MHKMLVKNKTTGEKVTELIGTQKEIDDCINDNSHLWGDVDIEIIDLSKDPAYLDQLDDEKTEVNFNKGKKVKKFIARINRSKGDEWMKANALILLQKYAGVNVLLSEGFLPEAAVLVKSIKDSGDFSIYTAEEADSIIAYTMQVHGE